VKIGETADLGERFAEVLASHAKRHDSRVDPAPSEAGIVYAWRSEARRWVADMRDEFRIAVDHGRAARV
jgi:hypothetical protein